MSHEAGDEKRGQAAAGAAADIARLEIVAGNRMKVLLTSVGSLVGQNILDVLEYPGFSRRSLMRVVGSNSVPDAACNFRCDRCYLLPLTATAEYSARMREICWRSLQISYCAAATKTHSHSVN